MRIFDLKFLTLIKGDKVIDWPFLVISKKFETLNSLINPKIKFSKIKMIKLRKQNRLVFKSQV